MKKRRTGRFTARKKPPSNSRKVAYGVCRNTGERLLSPARGVYWRDTPSSRAAMAERMERIERFGDGKTTWHADGSVEHTKASNSTLKISSTGFVAITVPADALNPDTTNFTFQGEGDFGCGVVPFAGTTGTCGDDVDHPFASCANDPTDLCCRFGDMTAIGEAETAGGACIGLPACGATSAALGLAGIGGIECNGTPLGFPANGFIGNWPFTGFIPTAERLVVYCDGGSVRIAALDADNCDVTPSHSVAWDPDTLTGTVTFPGQVGTCCFENEATTEMRILLELQ